MNFSKKQTILQLFFSFSFWFAFLDILHFSSLYVLSRFITSIMSVVKFIRLTKKKHWTLFLIMNYYDHWKVNPYSNDTRIQPMHPQTYIKIMILVRISPSQKLSKRKREFFLFELILYTIFQAKTRKQILNSPCNWFMQLVFRLLGCFYT